MSRTLLGMFRERGEGQIGQILGGKIPQKSTPNMTGRRFHRTMEMIPARKSPSVSTPIKLSTKKKNARGTSEVWRRTSSIHFHCPVPRSSSHIGHGKNRGRKRHINIWHINNSSVTPVTDPPGRIPESSRPGTRTKMFMLLVFRTQHINF